MVRQGAMHPPGGPLIATFMIVVVLGKMAFGRKSTNYDTPQSWEITQVSPIER